MNVKLKAVLISFGTILLVLFFCEYLIYYLIIWECLWPKLSSSSPSLRAVVLADTHLLGRIRGHWFDKIRREWQMYRSFQTSVHLLEPNVVIILGDIFDEGDWASDKDFDGYVKRFHQLFSVNSDTHMIVIVGNHDIGFHYWTDSYLRRRFQFEFNVSDVDLIQMPNGVHFVSVNSMALEGDNCHFCANAEHKILEIGRKLKTKGISPIVLMHFPLHRQSEQICTESDSAPEDVKTIKYRPKLDSLSKEATDFVLRVLNPRLVLTGHSHHSCFVNHKSMGSEIPEWTVSSFNWRNKINPSFLLAAISSEEYSLYKCFLPNENFIFYAYILCSLYLIVFNIWFCFVRNRFKLKTK